MMPRGITLKGMQSAAALGGNSNQTAMKKTSPAGSMYQYVPDHQYLKFSTPCWAVAKEIIHTAPTSHHNACATHVQGMHEAVWAVCL